MLGSIAHAFESMGVFEHASKGRAGGRDGLVESPAKLKSALSRMLRDKVGTRHQSGLPAAHRHKVEGAAGEEVGEAAAGRRAGSTEEGGKKGRRNSRKSHKSKARTPASTLGNPTPETPHPKPSTLDPEPCTPNPDPAPQTLNPAPQTLNFILPTGRWRRFGRGGLGTGHACGSW